MNERLSGIRGTFLVAMACGLLAMAGPAAQGAGGGRSGHHGGRAPRVSAPRQTFRAPRMPRAPAPAHANATSGRSRSNPAHRRANPAPARTHHGTVRGNTAAARANNAAATAHGARSNATSARSRATSAVGSTTRTTAGRVVSPAAASANNARRSLSGTHSAHSYTYGYGAGARRYRAFGYGTGYRNRYYGGRYGYGRSQANNRAIVWRLRSVHASLARLDRDYQGHRVRAMHAIAMAIRQLSHRSMVYRGVGFAPGMNNAMGMGRGMRRSVLAGGGRGGQVMPQAQSDARMSQALRNVQGIGMQLVNQGSNTMGHARALGHVQQAAHELNVALSIR